MFFWTHSSIGQEPKQEKEKKQTFPISVTLSNQSWAFPLSKIFRLNPYYPGASLGTEYYYLKRPKSKLFQTLEVGGFINKNQGSALYVNSNITYRNTTKFGLVSEIGLGFGYFNSFHPTAIYEQQADGDFELVKDSGVPAFSNNLSLALGYDLTKKFDKKLMPFLRYQWIASGKYWSIIGIRPSALLHLGLQFNFK